MAGSKNDDQRRRIAGIACEMFLAEGYEKVKLKAVAEASGVSQSLLRYYFPKRADLAVGIFYDLIIACKDFLYDELGPIPAEAADDADLVYLDVFYHVYYEILHRDSDRLLQLYTVVLYDTERLQAGTNHVWDHRRDMPWPGRTFKSRIGVYALNGALSQFVVAYLADRFRSDLDQYVTMALGMCYDLIEVDAQRRAVVLAASAQLRSGEKVERFIQVCLEMMGS